MTEDSKRPPGGDGGGDEELAVLAHRTRRSVPVALIGASALTAVHDLTFELGVAAVVAWLVAGLLMLFAAPHEWMACSYCEGPPARIATPEARARLARKIHGPLRYLPGFLVGFVVTAAVLPKPYLAHTGWWGRVLEGAVVLAAASLLMWGVCAVRDHRLNQDECYKENCRADLPRRLPTERQTWVGHYALWALLALTPVTATVGILTVHRHDHWRFAYPGLLLVVFILLTRMGRFHSDTPCLVCARRTPLDGEAAADKRMRWLRAWHFARVGVYATALGVWLVSWMLPGTVAGRALVGIAAVTLLVQLLINRVHSSVQPFCPWCHDGGDDITEDAPDPGARTPIPA